MLFAQIEVDGRSHRGSLGRGGFDVEAQAGVLHGFYRGRAEGGDTYVALLEVGEVFEQRLNALGAEEHEHVVVESLVGTEVVAHGAVHRRLRHIELVGREQGALRAVVDIAHYDEEVLCLVFLHCRQEVGEFACGRGKDFTLAVYDVFLQIVGDGFTGAEIFQGHRYGDSHFLAKTEEMVDCRAGSEYNGRKIGNIDFLLTKFFCRKPFDLDERTKYQLYIVLLSNVEVRRLVGRRLRLGYKYLLDFHSRVYYKVVAATMAGALIRLLSEGLTDSKSEASAKFLKCKGTK